MHEKRATLIVWKAERNKVHGVPKVHRTKIAEELGIRVRKVTEKMLGCSDKIVDVSRFSHT
jgi:hypothetical protein